MRLITHVSLVSAMIPRLRCRNLNKHNSDISKICANLLCTKTDDETKQSCLDSSVLKCNHAALKLNDNSKNKKKNIMIRKYYIEKQLFGELIKESKKKHVQLPQTQLVNEIKSVNNEPELQWILKTSNAKYIKHMCNTEQKCTNEELSKHGIESVIYKDDSQNKMEIHDTLKYTSENLLQWTNITSFPIFGSETSENKCIRHKAINLNMKIPSVTKVLRDTIPPNARAALEEWKANMIQKLGLLQFERYCEGAVLV